MADYAPANWRQLNRHFPQYSSIYLTTQKVMSYEGERCQSRPLC